MKKVSRTIHYYHLPVEPRPDDFVTHNDLFMRALTKCIQLTNARSDARFVKSADGSSITIREVTWDTVSRRFKGKMSAVRGEFPELLDKGRDVVRDIDANEDEGVVEVSHFMLDLNGQYPTIALEYNHYGPKIQHFNHFVCKMAELVNHRVNIGTIFVVRDTLQTYLDRMSRCARFVVSVHEDNIARVREIDEGIATALEAAHRLGHSELVKITLGFDWRRKNNTETIMGHIKNLVRFLLKNKGAADTFETLSIEAEDAEHGNRLNLFDLLTDKIKSVVKVEVREKTGNVVSIDMFGQLESEMNRTIGLLIFH
jgi:hypothetical protein